MRVILARLRRTARDDDLPLRVLREIDVFQRPALLLPQRLLFSGSGFPRMLRSLGGVGDLGLGLGESGKRREQQGGEEGEVGFHG